MDLREVIERVKNTAESAYSSFHAGRRDDAENYLMEEMQTIAKYLDEKTTPAGDVTEQNKGKAYSMADAGATKEADVTESAASEKPAETPEEKPAEVPGAVLPATQFDPAAAAQQIGQKPEPEKPTQ